MIVSGLSELDSYHASTVRPDDSTTSLIYNLSIVDNRQSMLQAQYLHPPQRSAQLNSDLQQISLPRPLKTQEWAPLTAEGRLRFPNLQQDNPAAFKRQSNHMLGMSEETYSNNPTLMNQQYDYTRQFMPSWEGNHHSPASPHRHLPTPSHTPTQDSFPQQPRQQSLARLPSSVTYELPVTPRTMNGDEFETQIQAPPRTVPKFQRTISDIYQDELYNPSFSQPIPQQVYNRSFLQPNQQQPSNIVNERLQAAHQARSASPGGNRMRAVSPFRPGSTAYAQVSGQLHLPSDSHSHQRPLPNLMALQKQVIDTAETEAKTISPKDAVLDYKEDPEDASVPLFPQDQSAHTSQQQQQQLLDVRNPMSSYGPNMSNRLQQFGISDSSPFDFNQLQDQPRYDTQQARYAPVPNQPSNSQSSQQEQQNLDMPAHLVSMETSRSEDPEESDITDDDEVGRDDDDDDEDDDNEIYDDKIRRPAKMTADSGTYTCTYHGCRERFESPARLQKHKREDHRSTGHGGPPVPTASPSAAAMTQAGPHRCDRTNPQTGKPCNTIFSRPYDLTRHEDTIHNRQKTKVRCHLCTDEKTFSRSDALTRHMKVVHPTAPWPAKHKKRPS